MAYLAVIDTETNWNDAVMSIGIALADAGSLCLSDSRYYVLSPEYQVGGMYSEVLDLVPRRDTRVCTRSQAMAELGSWLSEVGVVGIFAYNARFDRNHMPELSGFPWYDIMRIAAYRQYNPFIPGSAPCCSTGRLKSQYGVEPITRMLTGDCRYRETHNALLDAVDELNIMKCLGLPLEAYQCARL